MSEHILKVVPPYFDALLDGSKTFEVRRNDRGFQKGDTLTLWEYDRKVTCDRFPCKSCQPRSIEREVAFIFSGDPALRDCGGVLPGYVVLALAPVTSEVGR